MREGYQFGRGRGANGSETVLFSRCWGGGGVVRLLLTLTLVVTGISVPGRIEPFAI